MPAPKCPVCARHTLQRHCPETNTTCTWDACVNAACKANVDRITGKHSHHNAENCATSGPITRRPERR